MSPPSRGFPWRKHSKWADLAPKGAFSVLLGISGLHFFKAEAI